MKGENSMSAYDTIVKQVEEGLMADKRTQDANIEVTNERGIVTLLGEVDSAEIAAAAEEIARQQSGVIKVINSLGVEGETELLEGASPNMQRPMN
jgi:osmotically-inducible protein OsmY